MESLATLFFIHSSCKVFSCIIVLYLLKTALASLSDSLEICRRYAVSIPQAPLDLMFKDMSLSISSTCMTLEYRNSVW
ncbi:hypothetical protein F4806DRAFT_462661 [Annulohypoxylon nitens]|nr:hypothetical protein F4806DRAFT_462661 [Annulohypoxylon nitens]